MPREGFISHAIHWGLPSAIGCNDKDATFMHQ